MNLYLHQVSLEELRLYKKIIMIRREIMDAFSDSMTLNFSLKRTIKGIFPTISIIANKIIDAEINSLKSKFIFLKLSPQI